MCIRDSDIVVELLAREQIAFRRLARGIANHARGAAGQGDRMVTGELEPAQHQLAHEVADVEAVASRIETAIERDRPGGEALAETDEVGAIRDQFAPLEVFEEVHDDRAGYRGEGRGGQGESDRLMRIAAFPKRWLITGKTVCLDRNGWHKSSCRPKRRRFANVINLQS